MQHPTLQSLDSLIRSRVAVVARGTVWNAPTEDADAGSFLVTDGNGNLVWAPWCSTTDGDISVMVTHSVASAVIRNAKDISASGGTVGLAFETWDTEEFIPRIKITRDRIDMLNNADTIYVFCDHDPDSYAFTLRNSNNTASSLHSVRVRVQLTHEYNNNSVDAGYIAFRKSEAWVAAGNRRSEFAVAVRAGSTTDVEVLKIDSYGKISGIDQVIRHANGVLQNKSFTVATLPAAGDYVGGQIYVSNGAAGSPMLAFSDGTNWLRVDDRSPVSSS